MRARFLIFAFAITATFSIAQTYSQSPAPIVVQSATSVAPGPAPAATSDKDLQATIKLLEEMKTANDDAIKKQEATLDALDELQKAAEQIKIFSKRG
jgi:hypothetical protein